MHLTEDHGGPCTIPQLIAALVAAGLALAACGTHRRQQQLAAAAARRRLHAGQNLAFLGATTGDYGALGQNMVDGIKLALDEYNKKNADCKVDLKVFDSQGNPEKAPRWRPRSSTTTRSSVSSARASPVSRWPPARRSSRPACPSISPSATNVTITQQGWTTWHRVIGNDDAQGAADAKYMTDTAGAKKVYVVDDGSDYGKGLAGYVKKALGAPSTDTDTVRPGRPTCRPRHQGEGSGADAFFYGGYYAEAGLLAKQLRQAGFKGLFMSGDGSEDPAFVKAAGAQAADGAILSAPAGPAPADFNSKYKAVNGSDAGSVLHAGLRRGEHLPGGLDAGKTQPGGHQRLHRQLHRRRRQRSDRLRREGRHHSSP